MRDAGCGMRDAGCGMRERSSLAKILGRGPDGSAMAQSAAVKLTNAPWPVDMSPPSQNAAAAPPNVS